MQELENLVEDAKNGNATAFARLYEIYFEKVYRYLAAKLGNPSEAEDLAQEVFVKVLRSLESFHWKGRPFSAWLFRIAHNLMLDYLRREKPRETIPMDELPPIQSQDDPAEQTEMVLNKEQLKLAINRLSPSQQQVVLLRFMAELSIAETASTVGKNENAVKALQHAALASLRKILVPKLTVEG